MFIENKKLRGTLKYLNSSFLNTTSAVVEIVLKLLIYMQYSNVSEEKSFSVLKGIKNHLVIFSKQNKNLSYQYYA